MIALKWNVGVHKNVAFDWEWTAHPPGRCLGSVKIPSTCFYTLLEILVRWGKQSSGYKVRKTNQVFARAKAHGRPNVCLCVQFGSKLRVENVENPLATLLAYCVTRSQNHKNSGGGVSFPLPNTSDPPTHYKPRKTGTTSGLAESLLAIGGLVVQEGHRDPLIRLVNRCRRPGANYKFQFGRLY